MNSFLPDYLNKLQAFEPKGFNVSELRQILAHDAFNWVNFRLLESLVNDSDEGIFQIVIPNQQIKSEWLRPIFTSIALLKWQENAINTTPQYHLNFKPNCRYYLPRRGIEYIALGGNAFRLANDTNATRRELTMTQCAELVALSDYREEHDRRTVRKALKDYFDFFQQLMPNASTCPTHFTSRILVVSERGITEDAQHIPYQYNGDAPSLPIQPLIQVVNSWDDAADYLENDASFDTLFIVGTPKYRDKGHAILQSQIRFSQLKKIVLIGSEKLDTEADMRTWHWTFEELAVLKHRKLVPFERLAFAQKELNCLQKDVEMLEKGVYTEGVTLASFSQKLLNFPLRQVVATETVEILKDRAGQLLMSDFTTQAQFADWPDEKIARTESALKQLLTKAFDIVCTKQPKYEEILNRVRQNERMRVRIITSRQEASVLNQFFEAKGFYPKRAKAVTIGEFDRSFSDKSEEVLAKTTFIIPHIYFKTGEPLAYYHLFQKARRAASVLLLHYDLPIESERLDRFAQLFELDVRRRLLAKDRVDWLEIEFPQEILEVSSPIFQAETTAEQAFDDFFSRYFKNGIDDFVGQNENEVTDWDSRPMGENFTPSVSNLNRVRWHIEFDNGNSVDLPDYFQIVKKDKSKVSVERLQCGDEVIYFNITPEDSRPALAEIPEAKEILSRIKAASRRWHSCFESLQIYGNAKKQGSATDLKIKYGITVSPNQIESWLAKKGKELFPRSIEDLSKILDGYRRIKTDMTDVEMNEILSLQNQAASLREVVTKLNRELIEYSYRKNTEGLPMLAKIPAVHLESLLLTQQFRRVKKIEKTDNQSLLTH